MHIYLIRHGVTQANIDGIWQGRTIDAPLSTKGIEQARLAAQRFRNIDIKAVYSSTLIRAKTTAAIISQQFGLEVKEVKELEECAIDLWSGLTIDQVKEQFGEEFEMWSKDPIVSIEGVESKADLQIRAVKAVKWIINKHDEADSIIIVTHGLFLRAFFSWLMQISINSRVYGLENTGISHLTFEKPDHFRILSLNETWHLDGFFSLNKDEESF